MPLSIKTSPLLPAFLGVLAAQLRRGSNAIGSIVLEGDFLLVRRMVRILVRNVVTGLDSVAPETKDAARGMGLTDRQILWRVELPLALPVIVAGIRIAVVTVIGIAVLGALIGAGGLGVLIFDGIQRNFPTLYVTGAIMATLLAILTDLLFVQTERFLSPWTRARGAR